MLCLTFRVSNSLGLERLRIYISNKFPHATLIWGHTLNTTTLISYSPLDGLYGCGTFFTIPNKWWHDYFCTSIGHMCKLSVSQDEITRNEMPFVYILKCWHGHIPPFWLSILWNVTWVYPWETRRQHNCVLCCLCIN